MKVMHINVYYMHAGNNVSKMRLRMAIIVPKKVPCVEYAIVGKLDLRTI